MSVRFVLGRAGAGKTEHCLRAMTRAMAEDAGRPPILLVPEQASLQMERALAATSPTGGYVNALVVSFSRFAERVWSDLGVAPPLLSARARMLALRALVVQRQEVLRYFRQTARTPGFFVHLERLIEELLSEGVMPEALARAADEMTDQRLRVKTAEVAELYAAYLDWLGPRRVDPAMRLKVLREHLEREPWLDGARIWVDGFAGFTGEELQTLVTLGRRAATLEITLLTGGSERRDEQGELPLFARTETTQARLVEQFEAAGVAREPDLWLAADPLPRFAQSDELAAVERVFAQRQTLECTVNGAVGLRRCATHEAEIRAAARDIRRRVRVGGGQVRYRDFALIARDLGLFHERVAAIFAEYDVPVFVDRRRPMRAHPLCRLVLGLLDVVTHDAPAAAMQGLLSSPLLPVGRTDRERLLNFLARYEVRGWATWRMPRWDVLFRGVLTQATDGGRVHDPRAARLRLVSGLAPLLEKTEQPSVPGATWAEALLEALRRLEVPQTLERWIAQATRDGDWDTAELHRLAWETLCETLGDLHAVLGATVLDVRGLADVLTTALNEATIGLAPPMLDQVLVSAIERSRHPTIRHAWVFAFNEGIFPAPPTESPLFSNHERAALEDAGLAAPQSSAEEIFDEELLAYIAFTRPSESLTISFAGLSEQGAALEPSPLLELLQRRLPGLRIENEATPGEQPPTTLREFAESWLSYPDREQPPRLAALHRRLTGTEAAAQVAQHLRGRVYRNVARPVVGYRGARGTWRPSPSELEVALQCPFKHFVRYGLGIREEPGLKNLALEVGTLAHAVLADVTRAAIASGKPVQAIDDAQWEAWCAAAVGRAVAPEDASNRDRAAQQAFLVRLLQKRFSEVLQAQVARWRRGRFQPVAAEEQLGQGVRRAQVTLAGGEQIELIGKIDRIDATEIDGARHFLIYDYKTYGRTLAKPFLTGERLQAFIYGLAWQQLSDATFAGALLAPLRPDAAVLTRKFASAMEGTDELMLMYRPRGLFREATARALDDALDTKPSPVANMRLKKDGGFHSNCDAVADQEVARRLELAAETVRFAGARVQDGDVQVAPLVENQTLACQTCQYQTLCRFDRAYNQPQKAEVCLPTLDEMDAECS